MKKKVALLAASAFLIGGLCSAQAQGFAGTGSGGSWQDEHGSTAVFSIQGDYLQLILTSGREASVPSDVLTAIFFNANQTGWTESSAMLAEGSGVVGPWTAPTGWNGNVGSEWGYRGDGSVLAFGASQGISSTGLDLFHNGTFPSTYGNLDPPPNHSSPLDGMSFGLVNGLDNPNGGLEGNAMIQNSVVFRFGLPSGFDVSSLDNVTFFYGTSLGQVPDGGSTLALMGIGLFGAAVLRRKIRKA